MNIVIGSGPSGIACAHALLDRGEEVLLLDAGITRDSGQQTLLDRIRQDDITAVSDLMKLQSRPELSAKGVIRKLVHGSDFPYRGAVEHLGFEGPEASLLPSLARGGFSNVWGAAALPYRQEDMTDWPIGSRDLEPHYKAILRITGLAAHHDQLAESFPIYHDHPHPLQLSSQAIRVRDGLERISASLLKHGITFGASRLTVGPNLAQNIPCIYCGQCLHGCPYGCIYNSSSDVDWLLSRPETRFRYRADSIMEKVVESGGTTVVSGYDRSSRTPFQLEAGRVFLAAGVIPTARIMLKSMEAYDHPVQLKDSQYFVLPLVSSWSGGAVSREALHTLSQLFIEIRDQDISPYTVHLQLYTYNDIIDKMLLKKLQFAGSLRRLLVPSLRGRILVIQGYLHSSESGTIELKLSRTSTTGRDSFTAKPQPGERTAKLVQRVVGKLRPHLLRLGLLPIPGALEIAQPGRGFHSGGSFPMRSSPGAGESDGWGRPFGLKRVHLVDASTFPSIPASTITLTAMANSYRIAKSFVAES